MRDDQDHTDRVTLEMEDWEYEQFVEELERANMVSRRYVSGGVENYCTGEVIA